MSITLFNAIESAVTLAIFYLFYRVFLKNETFFKLNRLYLLASLLFSVIIPFLNLSWGVFSNNILQGSSIIYGISEVQRGYNEINEVIVYAYSGKLTWTIFFKYLSAIYFLGLIISSSFFLFGLGKVIVMIWQNKSSKYGKYRIIETPDAVVPFSLFKWIIINPEKYSSKDMEQIIIHERMHAFQLHSLDLILIEVLVILFWFNPFIYWYRKSIREVHEYLADQAVVENGHDHIDYQKLLLSQVSGDRFIGLSSRFSYSLSKNRLKMLSMIKTKNTSKIKIAFAIPLIIVFVVFFTNCESEKSDLNSNSETETTKKSEEQTGLVIIEDLSLNEEEVFQNADIMPKFDGKDADAFRDYIQKNVAYPKIAIENGIAGRVFVQFNVSSDGDVVDAVIVRGVDPSLDKEALRVVNSSPKWTPGRIEDKPVTIQYTFPITFALS